MYAKINQLEAAHWTYVLISNVKSCCEDKILLCASSVRAEEQGSPRVHAGSGALPFLCRGRGIKRTFLHRARVCVGASEPRPVGHRSVPADLQCKMLLNLEYLLGLGLKLLTAPRAWGKTERKDSRTGSESPFSALTQPGSSRNRVPTPPPCVGEKSCRSQVSAASREREQNLN